MMCHSHSHACVQFDSLVVVVSLMSIYRITRMMHARALFYWKINEFFGRKKIQEEGAKYFELYFYFLTALYKRDRAWDG